jgi:uncharacterized membrane protein YqaE (UPF0057 family)
MTQHIRILFPSGNFCIISGANPDKTSLNILLAILGYTPGMIMNVQINGSQRLIPSRIILIMFLLASCSPGRGTPQPATPFPTQGHLLPTGTLLRTSTFLPTFTFIAPLDNLIAILEVSDPTSSTYDPSSASYALFPQTLKQLAALNSSSNNAASMIAYAMGFPRPDSILAADALITLGPDWAVTDMVTLIPYLTNPRAELRLYSLIVLSITGHNGSCSLGQVGPLLRDPDPYVRTAAALAIQGITGEKLVPSTFVVTPDLLSPTPVAADSPEGSIVGAARTWWDAEGSKTPWHPSYDLCDP